MGVAQTVNSTEVEKNFHSILFFLKKFESAGVNLVLFPECCLSGFSSHMSRFTIEMVKPYLDQVIAWSEQTGIKVVLPTAYVENGKVFNSGFWIDGSEITSFYKSSLTESENKFFSCPQPPPSKIFRSDDFRFAILICFEAEVPPWTHFQAGQVDAVLWPGYWGWTPECAWAEEKEFGVKNRIYENVKIWRTPLLQANFVAMI